MSTIIHDLTTGEAVSGTRQDVPAPDGLGAVTVPLADFRAMQRGELRWDPATLTLVPSGRPTDADRDQEEATRLSIEQLLANSLDEMRDIIDAPLSNNAQRNAAIKAEARAIRRLIRLAAGVLDGTD